MLRSGELVAEVEDALEMLWHDAADVAAVTEGLREATNAARHDGPGSVLDGLRTEYARLFTGPGLAAVAGFESQYAGGRGDPGARLFGEVTTAVEQALAEEGVQAAAGLPADRATAELEFLYYLSVREASAWQSGDRSEADRLGAVRDRFIGRHAGTWLPLLAGDLGEQARSELYAGLATLLGTFLRAEADSISRTDREG